MSSVAVLGCGPSGLIAAHALKQEGHTVEIYSRKQKSIIPGSQYLHERIPDITPELAEHAVLYVRLGTAESYAGKVYGDPRRNTGWPVYDGVYPSWSVFNAYDKLWGWYSAEIQNVEVGGDVLLPDMIGDYDLVVSTLPAQEVCHRHHTFNGERYWIKTLPTPKVDEGREIVIYNGLPTDQWYRWSILGGVCSIESTMYMEGAVSGLKAVSTDCDCYPSIKRVGRWAQWKHGVLLHNAYYESRRIGAALKGEAKNYV